MRVTGAQAGLDTPGRGKAAYKLIYKFQSVFFANYLVIYFHKIFSTDTPYNSFYIMSDYIHLHNHTHYSLQDGACTVESLINAAKKNNMHAVDRKSTRLN